MMINENTVFIITFFRLIMSQTPRMATMVNNNTQPIRMYETIFFIVSMMVDLKGVQELVLMKVARLYKEENESLIR